MSNQNHAVIIMVCKKGPKIGLVGATNHPAVLAYRPVNKAEELEEQRASISARIRNLHTKHSLPSPLYRPA